MAAFRATIGKHSLIAYYILAFAISWGSILGIIGPGSFTGSEKIPESLLPLVYVATLLGPSLSGIIMTAIVGGTAGIRQLFRQLINWRVSGRWYAVALATAPLLIIGLLLILSLKSPEFTPAIFSGQGSLGLLLAGIVMGVFVGLFEEIGWTGFAAPRMIERYRIIHAGLVMGFLWGLWHLPLFSSAAASSAPVPPLLYVLVLLFSFLPPYRILMVWLYENTRSLPLVILMHAPLAASQLILIPPGISGTNVIAYDLLLAGLLWIFVAIVAVVRRGYRRGASVDVRQIPGAE